MGTQNEEMLADVFIGGDDTPDYTDEELTLPEKTFSDDQPADESGEDGGGNPHDEPADEGKTDDQPADDQPKDEADPASAEETGEGEEAEPEAAAKKPITIPKERLDRELNRSRNLQKQLDEMKAQLEQQVAPEKQEQSTVPDLDIPDAKAIAKALIEDADPEKFAELYTKSMQAVAATAREQALAQAKQAAPAVYSEQQRQERFNQAAAEVEETYSFLKPVFVSLVHNL